MFTLLFVVEVYFTFAFLDCVGYHKGFVKSRFVILIVACRTRFALSAKCRVRLAWLTKVPISVYCIVIVILAGLKKIVRFTEICVI